MSVDKEFKVALLKKAFKTPEGTLVLYRAAHLPEPATLADTADQRARDFNAAISSAKN